MKLDKAALVFEKLAYGPVVNNIIGRTTGGSVSGYMVHLDMLKTLNEDEIQDLFMSISDKKKRKMAKEKGYIMIGPGLDLPWTRKSDAKKHELVHWVRRQKGKWSAKNYNTLPGTLIEEFAAYHRAGESIPRSVQGAIGTAVLQEKIKPAGIMRKIMFRKLI